MLLLKLNSMINLFLSRNTNIRMTSGRLFFHFLIRIFLLIFLIHLLRRSSLVCYFLHQIKVNCFLPFNNNNYHYDQKEQDYRNDEVYEEVLLFDVIVIVLTVVNKVEFVTCLVWNCQNIVFVAFG